MIGSTLLTLAAEKNVLTLFRRMRCFSWLNVATIESGAGMTHLVSLIFQQTRGYRIRLLPLLRPTHSGLSVFLPVVGNMLLMNSASLK